MALIRFERYGSASRWRILYKPERPLARRQSGSVYTSKGMEDCQTARAFWISSAAIAQAIWPNSSRPTHCIGVWHYDRDVTYKTPSSVSTLLVNIVSERTLLFELPLNPMARWIRRRCRFLSEITAWMQSIAKAFMARAPGSLRRRPSVEAR